METEEHFQTKVGQLFASVSKGAPPEHVRVEVGRDVIKVCRHDMVYEDVLATKDIVNRRTVLLERSEEGLGIAIQGGVDFKLPVSIDTVFENTPASRSGQIQSQDVLLEVNGASIWGKTHEEAASLLKAAGQFVTLTLASLREKNDDDGDDFQQEEDVVDYWIPFSSVSLKMASVSCYTSNTAILKPHMFQVTGCDESSKVTLQCDEQKRGQLGEWLSVIRHNISHLCTREMNVLNVDREESDQLVLMDWVYELLSSTPHTKVWKRKFLVLKKSNLQIYDSYPTDFHEWSRPVHTHQLTELTTRVLKPHEMDNQRANSVLLTSGKGYTHIVAFETPETIRRWTQTIHQLTVTEVTTLQSLQFPGRWKNDDIIFCVDLRRGFVVQDKNTTVVKWKKPFSWLCGSSDDGHSWLRLAFSRPNSQHNETQEIELEDLQLAMIAIECFMVTKVTTLDPNYISQTDIIAQPST